MSEARSGHMFEGKTIAVLFGGKSAEREVSLKSGAAVLSALKAQGLDAIGFDPADDGFLQSMVDQGVDHAFIALHGVGGEDGTIQGALETLNITYTGSAVMASALAMDKYRSKLLWRGLGLPTADFTLLEADSDFAAVLESMNGKVMVKPVKEGSSIGMSCATNPAELEAAYVAASQYDCEVMAEQWVTGAEYTVAVLGDEVLPAIKLEPNADFYDFDAKYKANDTRYLCPCGLSDVDEAELKQLAKAAFDSLACKGWGRVDVMADKDGRFFVLEVNTSPGMTSHSLVPMAAAKTGRSFERLVLDILALSSN
jgi:D-alanine-D-alanine ligase